MFHISDMSSLWVEHVGVSWVGMGLGVGSSTGTGASSASYRHNFLVIVSIEIHNLLCRQRMISRVTH